MLGPNLEKDSYELRRKKSKSRNRRKNRKDSSNFPNKPRLSI